jgi:hypothetical protein
MELPQQPSPAVRPGLKERIKLLFEKYGYIAVGVFVGVSALTYAAAYLVVSLGWKPQSTAGEVTTYGIAYVVYRLLLPVRIAVAAALTPLLAKVLSNIRAKRA